MQDNLEPDNQHAGGSDLWVHWYDQCPNLFPCRTHLQVDPKPEGSAKGANLGPVARAAWAAAVLGLPEAAERWASRAAMSQELGPRIWSDMVRALLTLQVRWMKVEICTRGSAKQPTWRVGLEV
jgi:hypothetical protein